VTSVCCVRLVCAAVIAASTLALSPAQADIVVHIDKSSQRMAVSVDGATRYNWPVSTGRRGYGMRIEITNWRRSAAQIRSHLYRVITLSHAGKH